MLYNKGVSVQDTKQDSMFLLYTQNIFWLLKLLGFFWYLCSQELVNLLLCGRAVSNVFDNDVELDSGNGNITLLKGVKGHCDVGLLSLFEHYNICKVSGWPSRWSPLH